MNLTKKDIAETIADECNLKKYEAKRAVDAIISIMKEAITNGEDIELRGLGTFKVKDTPQRKGRNIQKGTLVDIPATKMIKFKCSKSLIKTHE